MRSLFPIKLYLLLARVPFVALALSDHKLTLKYPLSVDLFQLTVTLKQEYLI